jgi:molybdopterin-biosynthesis enzyme MoeA-like protein
MIASARRFGAVIVGDEILSGKRRDGHLAKLIELLADVGQELAYAHYIGDDPALQVETYRRTLASGDVVFSFGGIGSTPDDHTRRAAADALGVSIERHAEGSAILHERFGSNITETRLTLVDFPKGATLIPNPYNRVPGFSMHEHYWVPGFPEMSWPMVAWVLREHYSHLPRTRPQLEKVILIEGAGEADLVPMMQQITRDYPAAKLSSLPRYDTNALHSRVIEFSLRGDAAQVENGLNFAKSEIAKLGYPVTPLP